MFALTIVILQMLAAFSYYCNECIGCLFVCLNPWMFLIEWPILIRPIGASSIWEVATKPSTKFAFLSMRNNNNLQHSLTNIRILLIFYAINKGQLSIDIKFLFLTELVLVYVNSEWIFKNDAFLLYTFVRLLFTLNNFRGKTWKCASKTTFRNTFVLQVFWMNSVYWSHEKKQFCSKKERNYHLCSINHHLFYCQNCSQRGGA
jgi:hypothetical protein